jgi:hypothetical protein
VLAETRKHIGIVPHLRCKVKCGWRQVSVGYYLRLLAVVNVDMTPVSVLVLLLRCGGCVFALCRGIHAIALPDGLGCARYQSRKLQGTT